MGGGGIVKFFLFFLVFVVFQNSWKCVVDSEYRMNPNSAKRMTALRHFHPDLVFFDYLVRHAPFGFWIYYHGRRAHTTPGVASKNSKSEIRNSKHNNKKKSKI